MVLGREIDFLPELRCEDRSSKGRGEMGEMGESLK